jgi:hypothetical protein
MREQNTIKVDNMKVMAFAQIYYTLEAFESFRPRLWKKEAELKPTLSNKSAR